MRNGFFRGTGLLIFVMTPILAYGEPRGLLVSNTNLPHGSTVQISGTGFGTKAQAAPVQWDDFEGGKLGERIYPNHGWGYEGATDYDYPTYTNLTQRPNSTLSSYHDLSHDAPKLTMKVAPCAELYVTYWCRHHITVIGHGSSGVDPWNIKELMYHGTGGDWVTGVQPWGTFADNQAPGFSVIHVVPPPSNMYARIVPGPYEVYKLDVSDSGVGWPLVNDQWRRRELWVRVTDELGQAWKSWENAALKRTCPTPADWKDGVGPHMGDYNTRFCEVHFLYFIRGESDGYSQYDDIYIDTTQARVEIGDAPTFAACTHREIQIPTAWSDTSITVTVNQGSFQSGSKAYLYVVDADGNVNAAGYPLSFAELSCPVITGVSTPTVTNNNTLTITGTEFGTHADYSPSDATTLTYKFDDFENGVAGAVVTNGWINMYDGDPRYWAVRYTDANQRVGSSLSTYNNLTTKSASYLQLGDHYPAEIRFDWDEFYITYWRRLNITNIASPQYYNELFMCGDAGPSQPPPATHDVYAPEFSFSANWAPGTNGNLMSATFTASLDPLYSDSDGSCIATYRNETWDRHEMWLRIGDSPGQRFKYWENAVLRRNFQTPEEFPEDVGPYLGDNDSSFCALFIGMVIRTDSSGGAQFDDIYIDRTQARVELGDGATWEQCTHREIQIPTAWSDTSITVTVNQGSFQSGSKAYLYVVDADGKMNAQGFPVTFSTSEGSLPGPPGKPVFVD